MTAINSSLVFLGLPSVHVIDFFSIFEKKTTRTEPAAVDGGAHQNDAGAGRSGKGAVGVGVGVGVGLGVGLGVGGRRVAEFRLRNGRRAAQDPRGAGRVHRRRPAPPARHGQLSASAAGAAAAAADGVACVLELSPCRVSQSFQTQAAFRRSSASVTQSCVVRGPLIGSLKQASICFCLFVCLFVFFFFCFFNAFLVSC